MTLQQLKYIIEIVNCGSMNLAAQKLFVFNLVYQMRLKN